MSQQDYILSMGGNTNFGNNGINQTNSQVYKYYQILREYYCNRFTWSCENLNDEDLNLIEWLLFHRGYCAILKPLLPISGSKSFIYDEKYRVFEVAISRQNNRTNQATQINLVNHNSEFNKIIPKLTYNNNEFVIITCNQNVTTGFLSQSYIAWEYANKLHELDLLFNANSHKQRLPILFNNGGVNVTKEHKQNFNIIGTISDLVRSAMSRNEQFCEIPEEKIGDRGILHQTGQYTENNLKEYLEAQNLIFNAYLESIGVNIMQEKGGVYQPEEIQNQGLYCTEYKKTVALKNRVKGLKRVNELFGIGLSLGVN